MAGGKSRVEVLKEIDDFESNSKKRVKKPHRWYVCYFYSDNPDTWKMMPISAVDEKDAWSFVLKKIKKDGNVENAVLKYAKRVDADDFTFKKKIKKQKRKRVVDEDDETTITTIAVEEESEKDDE